MAETSAPNQPDTILSHAERLCAQEGVRLTDLRRRALLALAEAGRPIKAYDLLPALGDGKGPAKPATAYRALEFFESVGLVHKVAGINAYVLCSRGGGAHITSLYICEACGSAQEHAMPHAASCAPPAGFEIHRSVHEHYGRCADCVGAGRD